MKMKQLLLGVFAVAAAVLCGAGCACVSCPGNAATPLAGSAWKLDLATLSGTQSSWAKPANAITLSFAPAGKEAGRVSGCAGVNRYFGPVTLDEAAETIKFGNLASTMMAGPGMNYESTYLKALDTVDGYQISGEELVLTAGGKPVLKFEAVEAENDGNADQ